MIKIGYKLMAEEHGPAALVQEGSTDAQRVLRSTLSGVAEDAAAASIRPPAVVVIGEVVDVLA